MKKVRVEDAVGMVLGHDLTKIVPGEFKGPGFRKGHRIQREDVPEFLNLGKEHIYVIELREGELHEDDAALRLSRAFSGPGIETTGPREGRINLVAAHQGLLTVSVHLLERVNAQKGIVLATLHDNTPVEKGEIVAATRIIPLTIGEKVILRVESLCQGSGMKMVSVVPFQRKKVGVLVTGNEIYHRRIPDRSPDYVDVKVERYGSTVIKRIVSPDDQAFIARSLKELLEAGSDLILVTAGLSVDPDDVTVAGIRKAGATVRVYGTPVMPGSMFLYAYLDRVPILGLPACVLHHETTVFDLMFPRVLAGREITRKDIVRLGHGGLCLVCGKCQYPVCPFGKG
jgi:hypothetical protein